MNRLETTDQLSLFTVPRTRGDEPVIPNDKRANNARSPHARG